MEIDFESIFNFRWSWKLIFVCNFFFIVCGLQRMHSIALTQSLKSSRNWRVESGEETCLYKTCREEFWNLPSARRSDSQIVHSQCLLSSEKTDNQSIHPPSLFLTQTGFIKLSWGRSLTLAVLASSGKCNFPQLDRKTKHEWEDGENCCCHRYE